MIENKHPYELSERGIKKFEKYKIEELVFQKEKIRIRSDNYKKWKGMFKEDYEKMKMALGIYLECFARKSVVLSNKENDAVSIITRKVDHIDYLISFNYMDNFSPLYKNIAKDIPKICYVHGKVEYMEKKLKQEKLEDIIKTNKMVLGFNEYLSDEDKKAMCQKEEIFNYYRKHIQRMNLDVTNGYMDWIQEMRNSDERSNVYFWGHSLDTSDENVLKELFNVDEDKIKIYIYYHNDESREQMKDNLENIFSGEKIERWMSGYEPRLEFVH